MKINSARILKYDSGSVMNLPDIIKGDITRMEVSAIVNAANESLLGGGGVDGAIHYAAGPRLYEVCEKLPEVSPGVRCPPGEARITPGFDLPAEFIIHTVGPRWKDGTRNEAEILAQCYRNSLLLAAENDISSVAFPLISTGAFAYPLIPACRIAVHECAEHLRTYDIDITLVAYGGESFVALRKIVREIAG